MEGLSEEERAALRDDVAALAAMARGSASAGEAASAQWVAQRLGEAGAQDVRVERFGYRGTYAYAHAAHLAAGLVAARRGGARGAALAAAALASLELEASGRAQWVHRALPRGEGANVVARIPSAARTDVGSSTSSRARSDRRSGAERRIVIVAHHDAARTGLVWSPALVALGARPGVMPPRLGAAGLGLALAGLPWRAARRAGAALLAVGVAALLDVARHGPVPGANDNATGVAALLALARRLTARPLERTEVVLLAPGCEESGMGGMAAFLRARRGELRPGGALDPARTLVLGLDTLGSGTPIHATAEATLLPHAYRDEDVALAEAGAERAGVAPPRRWRVGAWTDPILARFAGLPAISLLSVDERGVYPNWHLPTDTPERVDWDSVEHSLAIAAGTLAERDRLAAS